MLENMLKLSNLGVILMVGYYSSQQTLEDMEKFYYWKSGWIY